MAVGTNYYHSNAFPGEVQLFRGDIFRDDATPILPVGARIARADGSVYRYAHCGLAGVPGILVAQDFSESATADADNLFISPASANDTSDGTIGSRFIQVTLASVTADQFAGGYLITTTGTGLRYTYRIKGNNATGDPASGDYRLELYDPLQVAVDNTTDHTIIGNVYANLELASAATDHIVAGVNMVATTIDQFYFVQTWGICGVEQDGTIASGDQVGLSDGVSGAMQAAGGGGTSVSDLIAEQILGYCVDAGDTGEQGVFYLQIAA